MIRETWCISFLKRDQHPGEQPVLAVDLPGARREDGIAILVDGYVLPRMRYMQELQHIPAHELVSYLYGKHGEDFTRFIKGNFTIVIATENDFQTYTDRQGINCCYVYQNAAEFILSNSLDRIADLVSLELDRDNAAVFTLLSHHLNGATQFKHVVSTTAGETWQYRERILTRSRYWKVEDLLTPGRILQKESHEYYAEQWKSLIDGYLRYLKPQGCSLTLTAGNDSRMVLAPLLTLGADPRTFTFGNPESYEAVISRQVAAAAATRHANYFVESPDSNWMEECALSLIELGNSTVSIQRAHRLDAYRREAEQEPQSEIIFTGLMGGEYIKMPIDDSTALHPLLLKVAETDDPDKLDAMLAEELERKCFRLENVELREVGRRIRQLTDRTKGYSDRERSFLLLYLFYGCSHHTQEARVLDSLFRYPVHPFMDIDFLEMLSESKAWYVNNRKLYNRLTHSLYLVAITHALAPQLSRVPYGKRGKYTAEEMLFKKFRFVVNRLRHIMSGEKAKYPPGFVLGKWMHGYCQSQLAQLSGVLTDLYDISRLETKLAELREGTTEYRWQILTNPINLGLNLKHYGKV